MHIIVVIQTIHPSTMIVSDSCLSILLTFYFLYSYFYMFPYNFSIINGVVG